MIEVTDNARNQAIKLMDEDNKPGAFIRVGVQGGGCSGLMYQLEFDTELKDTDKEFESNGIKVVVDKKSFLYLSTAEATLRLFLGCRVKSRRLMEGDVTSGS